MWGLYFCAIACRGGTGLLLTRLVGTDYQSGFSPDGDGPKSPRHSEPGAAPRPETYPVLVFGLDGIGVSLDMAASDTGRDLIDAAQRALGVMVPELSFRGQAIDAAQTLATLVIRADARLNIGDSSALGNQAIAALSASLDALRDLNFTVDTDVLELWALEPEEELGENLDTYISPGVGAGPADFPAASLLVAACEEALTKLNMLLVAQHAWQAAGSSAAAAQAAPAADGAPRRRTT